MFHIFILKVNALWSKEKLICKCLKDQWEKQSWSPTSPREAHRYVLIRMISLLPLCRGISLPPMCRGIFFHCCVLWGGEQNHESYGSQSVQYLHSWNGIVTDGIRARFQSEVWAPHVRTPVLVRGVDCEGLVGEAILESHIAWGSTWCAYKEWFLSIV